MLTFVDTDGTPPAATAEKSAIDVLMGAFASVSLNYDATNMTYTGITFGVVADNPATTEPDEDESTTLTVNFAAALNEAGLIEALADASNGGDTTIIDAATLAGVFASNTAPSTAAESPAALSTTGLALIDTLFGMTGDENNIGIGASLPEELL